MDRKNPKSKTSANLRASSIQEGGLRTSMVASQSRPMKQGYIKKWTNMVNRFQKRFFVLDNEVLSYYKDDKNSVTEKGQVSLKLAKIDPRTPSDKKITIYTGTSEIHLKFHNAEEKKEWLEALQEC